MKKFQASYSASAKDDPIRLTPLSVHAPSDTQNEKIIVFVHGLNGERYATWGKLPEPLFAKFQDWDFGFYEYANGFKRLNPFKSLSLEQEAQVLVDTLRDSEYREIILMGHSLGGVLIRIAITKMIEMNLVDLLSRIKVVFLFAVPQLGAHSLPMLVSFLNSDAAALSRNSLMIRRTTRVFLDHLNTDEVKADSSDSTWIPVYCIQAAEDFWVEELSATLNIKSHMRKVVRDSHTGVVKGVTDEVGDWITLKMGFLFPEHAKPKVKNERMIRHGPTTI
ncbi:hypothetical protein [uncultured Tateyamaria sp.]|uniref:esterase/lipase family protein n=1 Tax=uncultured Tateyamaria sp. TaxID=455651 RepID=UPI002604EB7C|nr:hypothetical protein [uncultured Tateyamaria sp.]